ncbi:flagellar basal body protein [Burkholderia sp. L27(2015)]|uniref:flagellar basal body protein n=1 Tax=Burkholderia sp. L27(2015) TaxID=1641858 RepID=UPI00131D64B8|nr:flagellar basal body protein [Burkholderia sp. L27(2015)]
MDRLDADFEFGKQALGLRAYRQEVLTSNIANADTPDYKARDIDFASTLTSALARNGITPMAGTTTLAMAAPSEGVAAGSGGVVLATDAGGQIAGRESSSEQSATLMYRNIAQPSLDNNTVDLDTERLNFADNSLHYETALNGLTGQIKAMLAALSTGT